MLLAALFFQSWKTIFQTVGWFHCDTILDRMERKMQGKRSYIQTADHILICRCLLSSQIVRILTKKTTAMDTCPFSNYLCQRASDWDVFSRARSQLLSARVLFFKLWNILRHMHKRSTSTWLTLSSSHSMPPLWTELLLRSIHYLLADLRKVDQESRLTPWQVAAHQGSHPVSDLHSSPHNWHVHPRW